MQEQYVLDINPAKSYTLKPTHHGVTCTHCKAPINVEGEILICPWHGCRFDLRGGRRILGEGPGLAVVPIAVDGGEVRIGVLTRVAA